MLVWPAILPAEAAPKLKANAGLDMDVYGETPIDIWFDGCSSTGDIVSWRWFNQWGQERFNELYPNPEPCQAQFRVNFGGNPQPGTTRVSASWSPMPGGTVPTTP
jgi:hypothetical protein